MWVVLIGILGVLVMAYVNAYFISRNFPIVRDSAHICRAGRMATFLHA